MRHDSSQGFARFRHPGGSRAVALSAAKTLFPTSLLGVWGLAQGARLISALPTGPSRALVRLTTKSARLYNAVTVDHYPPSPLASGDRGDLAGDPGGRSGSRSGSSL